MGDALDVRDVRAVEREGHVRSAKPPRANVSASCSVDTVMPRAPCATWRRPSSRHLCVLMCGRSETPRRFARLCHMREVSLHHIVIEQKGRGFYVNQGGGP